MLKIIIVEDEDIIRKGLVYTIDWLSMGCVVVGEAADGEEGLQKIIELEPDIVITDIKMLKMDGIEMIRQAMEQVEFKSLFLTSYAEFEYAKRAIQLKAYEYLLKPVNEEKIIETIQAIQSDLNKHRKEEFVSENMSSASRRLDFNYYMQLDKSESGYVAKAIQKIQESYADRISVESISDELGVSSSFLSRKFKEVTKHSFLYLLNGYRVQQAIKLLNSGKYRIYEISDMTGFGDYKHFCNVFKKYTSMSPTGFVKKRK
ncbi:response regulator transcription factor [Anaerosacchariphilus polymeriproducens]|uniref:Stage 0 sporulation protein A homolog n=1 Tax=Anaerosacchariphilus polymeriproducens TaxID=1812858 RepID=A0A371AUJ0_9FIRM|nr:response regulator [Anaerosacchariphilus polymeriproducens]RDU23209.1 response regulator [Anaerosacchariphilus polymeriproducens]